MRGSPIDFFGIRNFPYLRLRIRDLKAKKGGGGGGGARFGNESLIERSGMPKIALGITGLHEILDRDCRVEKP